MRQLDLFGIFPPEIKESSYISVAFSALFAALALFLLSHQLRAFWRGDVSSELIVDHRKDDREVRVSLDVTLFAYPCGLLSLDKLDALHTHSLDVAEGLRKVRLSSAGRELGAFAHDAAAGAEARLAVVEEQLQQREGCRVVGDFGIKLVPGNFHISFHAYVAEFRALLARGATVDFSHRVDRLVFGEETPAARRLAADFGLETTNSLGSLVATDLARLGFPHSVAHHLNIVPSRFVYEHTGQIFELYQYTSTMLQERGGAHIIFHLSIENVVMVFKLRPRAPLHLFVMLMAIFGGLHMLVRLVAALVEDSLAGLVFKRRIGKLD